MPLNVQTLEEVRQNHDDLELDIRVTAAMLALGTLFVALRLGSRILFKPRHFAWDDGMVVLGWLSLVAMSSANIYKVSQSFPLLTPTFGAVEEAAYIRVSKGVYGLQVAYVFAYTFPKLSICCLYLRIFTSRLTRAITWGTVVFISAQFISFLMGYIFLCIPVARAWDLSVPGSCLNKQTFDRSVNGPSIATDLILLILPLPTVWSLKTSVARKVGISLTFATGSIGLIASCIRWSVFFAQNIASSSVHEGVELTIWSFVEVTMYLTAACLPPLRGSVAKCCSGIAQSGITTIFGSNSSSRQSSLQEAKLARDMDYIGGSDAGTATTTTTIARGGREGSEVSDEIEKELERMAQLDEHAVHYSRSVEVTRDASDAV